jgi:hypothetical protein
MSLARACFATALLAAFVTGCMPPLKTKEQLQGKYSKQVEATKLPPSTSWTNQALIRFDEVGLHNTVSHYSIRFDNPKLQRFVGNDWYIEDYTCVPDRGRCRFVRKEGAAYRGIALTDRDENGTPEEELQFFFDLKLSNRKSGSAIWVRSDDIPRRKTSTYLDVFMSNYVGSLEGAEVAFSGSPLGYAKAKERKFVATVDEKSETTLGRYEALRADITLADVDKLRIDPEHRHSQIRVTMARIDGAGQMITWDKEDRNRTVPTSGKYLLLIGYVSDPQFFEASLPDYDQLISQLEFGPPPTAGQQTI